MAKNIVGNKFFKNAYEYISPCCHYNNHTLITKNGELIQTIQINGINQENISKNLLTLREILRNSLSRHLDTPDVACWIHTIRRKVSLDDKTPYPNLASQNIHDVWVKKNYWDDKFVNTLYVSFVYKGKNLTIANLNDFIKSFSYKNILQSHDEYLDKSYEKLNNLVDNVLSDISDFGSRKLGIVCLEEDAYCEILSFIYGFLRGIEEPIKLEQKDLSKIIGNFEYAVGSSTIEVISDQHRKYATIISLKEYQELNSKSLDRMLQQPTEFAITEVFYYIDKKIANKFVEYQNYLCNVSGDSKLIEQKDIANILSFKEKNQMAFCHQQISILLLNENLNQIEKMTEQVSYELSKVGLVHRREDINIENIFWSQIPGNFKFLRRTVPTTLNRVAAMASLHNYPAGNISNPWGRAVTILRSEKGTPYFFNFHSLANKASCLINGTHRSGKTTLANFFISESLKYRPKVLAVDTARDSYVFTKANWGKWIDYPLRLDPFKIEVIGGNDVIISEIMEVISYHKSRPMSEEGALALKALKDFILSKPKNQRNFSLISDFDYNINGGQELNARLKDYLPGGDFFEYYEDDPVYDSKFTDFTSISFENFSDQKFKEKNYPSEDRFLPEYYEKLAKYKIFRELLLISNILKFNGKFASERKIIKIENFNNFCSEKFSDSFYNSIFNEINNESTVNIFTTVFSKEHSFFKSSLWNLMQNIFDSKIYMPSEAIGEEWKNLVFLSDKEYIKLKDIIPSSRLFISKLDDLSITCELSLGGLSGVLSILSSSFEINAKCDEIIAQKGEDPNKWLIEFYDAIRK